MNEHDRKQHERHIAELLEGTLAAADLARLEAALADDAELRAYYLDYTRLHSLLHHTEVSPRDLGLAVSSGQPSEDSKAESGEPKAEEDTTHHSPVTTHQSPFRSLDRSLSRHRAGIGIAAGLLFVGVLIGWAAVTYLPGVAKKEQPQEETPAPEWIALLNHAHDAKWLDGTEPPANRPRLMPGQRLAISAGLLEINYRTGAKVIVEGPAEFTVGSQASGDQASGATEPAELARREGEGGSSRNSSQESTTHHSPLTAHQHNSGYLALGKLVARVEGRRAQGFSIGTPSVRVEDLGTEFGVDVDRKGTADVAVIEGAVDLVRDSGNERVRLTKGQGALVQTSGTPITRRGIVDPQQFAVLEKRMREAVANQKARQAAELAGRSTRTPGTVAFRTDTIQSSDGSVGHGMLGGPQGLVVALNFGDADTDLDIDITNGTVTFTRFDSGAENGGFSTAALAGDADINDMLNTSSFGDVIGPITLKGLVPGNRYRLQIFCYIDNFAHTFHVEVDGVKHENWTVPTAENNYGTAHVLIAEWKQRSGRTNVDLVATFSEGPNHATVSGLILHDVTDRRVAGDSPMQSVKDN